MRILQPQSEPAVLVPQRALRQVSGATYVFVIKNGRAEQRLVQTGQIEGDLVEINSGVAADEIVATTNVEQLSDGVERKTMTVSCQSSVVSCFASVRCD